MDKDQPAHLKGPAGTETPRTCQFSMYQTNRNTYYRQRPNIVALQEFKKFCQCLWRCHRTRTLKQRQHFQISKKLWSPNSWLLSLCHLCRHILQFLKCVMLGPGTHSDCLSSLDLWHSSGQVWVQSSSSNCYYVAKKHKRTAIGTTVGFEMTSDLEAQFLSSLYQASP